jgi:acetyltransferase-like isoleucine patch superfamily enzyme
MINKIRMAFWLLTSLRFKMTFRKFGNMSFIKAPIFLSNTKNISIGRNVKIWHHARLEAVTRYNSKEFSPEIIIEDNVGIQQNFHCTCASRVRIGKGTAITQNVGIFDIHHGYTEPDVSVILQDIDAKPVDIGENCFIGMNCVILPGTVLGRQTVVAAGSVVSGVFPGRCVIAGSPARIIKRYNPSSGIWEKERPGGEYGHP